MSELLSGTLAIEEVVEKLRHTIDNIKTLKPQQFSYSDFIKKSTDKCGTVCCIAGWYPKWYPTGRLQWVKVRLSLQSISLVDSLAPVGDILANSCNQITIALSEIHGITYTTAAALFTGHALLIKGSVAMQFVNDRLGSVTLEEVIERFEFVLKRIQDGY